MINAYKQGKDLYATIASGIYHNDYWDNMEFRQDGTANPEGKKRRGSVKSLMLGIMYGMGPGSLASAINGTIQDAQKIIDDFYRGFPKVKQWIDETYKNAKTLGFVEDMWGRRRRLPDIQLPKFEIITENSDNNVEFNPILNTLGLVQKTQDPKIEKYNKLLNGAINNKELSRIKDMAKREKVTINDNGGFISRAERQCVNARVQGGAATMSKRAMIKVHHDKELKNLGFRLMLAVHDELIGECPKENAQLVADRLCDIMKMAALPECKVPFKCDPTIESVWYETDYSDAVRDEYQKLLKTMSEEEAANQIYAQRCECEPTRLDKYIKMR